MKVCILSMQNVQNFGSLLQAYSLKNILEMLGQDVKFLKIEPNRYDNNTVSLAVKKDISEYSNSKLCFYLSKLDIYFMNRILHRLRYCKQEDIFNEFREEYFDQKSENEFFDLCVIGSDEVFNCLNVSEWGFTTQLFGNVRQAKNIITYAASCGATKYEMLPDEARRRIAKAFTNIKAFSVRDENTAFFVKQFGYDNVYYNLDPVIISDFSKGIEDAHIPYKIKGKYCLIYCYWNRIYKKEEIKKIKYFCRKKGLQIICVGYPQRWVKDYWILKPFELLKAFCQAEFVITDTFHGSIFSIKYTNRYAAIIKKSNHNKLKDLMHRVGKEEHIIQSFDELDKVYKVYDGKDDIHRIEKEEYEKTLEYLKTYAVPMEYSV